MEALLLLPLFLFHLKDQGLLIVFLQSLSTQVVRTYLTVICVPHGPEPLPLGSQYESSSKAKVAVFPVYFVTGPAGNGSWCPRCTVVPWYGSEKWVPRTPDAEVPSEKLPTIGIRL